MSNFKKAIRTTIIFLLVVVIMSTCIMELYFQSENYYYQDANERKELSGSLDYLVCGASHAMRGFRPDILDEELGVCSYNLSNSRLTMQGRYELLELEISRNPVHTLVLELSYDSLTRNRDTEGPEGDIYLLGKFEGFVPRMQYFFSAVRPSEYGRMYYEYMANGIDCLKKLVKGEYTTTNTKLYKGYAAYKRENIELNKNLRKIYNTEQHEEVIYDENMTYLQKIIDLCKENDIRLILTTVPLSKVTVCRYSNLDLFRGWYEEIAAANDLEFYDFNLLKNRDALFPDETAFSDRYHLSNEGAETFSRLFAEMMLRADAGENLDTLFYTSYQELDEQMDYSH